MNLCVSPQAFSIDIPTVLKAIQNTSATPSTLPPSSGTNVSSATGSSAGVENISPGNQHELQTSHSAANQNGQQLQTDTSGDSAVPQSSANTETGVDDVTLVSQTKPDQAIQEPAQISSETEKHNENGGEPGGKSSVSDSTVGSQNAIVNNIETSNVRRAETGNGSNGAATASTTNQTSQRRAPAIPPLPPCYTTLRTFKSLQMLRPQLQRIAAMLNPTLGSSTADSQVGQPSSAACPVVSSGSHSNNVSNVTSEAHDESSEGQTQSSANTKLVTGQNESVLSGKDNEALNATSDNETMAGEDHVVSPGCTRDIESSKRHPASAENVVTDDSSGISGTQLSDGNSVSGLGQAKASEAMSPSTSSQLDKDTVINTGVNIISTSTPVETNVTPPVTGTRLYRNSYEYKLLSSRFNSLFLWPSLLSKIPVKFSSQIGPVFVERHPPPKGGPARQVVEELRAIRKRRLTTKPPPPVKPKRKHPGLAAVRMASSTSFTTPAQQMCTVGQSAAIKIETNPAKQSAVDLSRTNEVVVAASQLVSLQETSKSLSVSAGAAKRPYNTRTSNRKIIPVKRRKRIIDSSSSSEDESLVIDDESDDSDLNESQERQITPQAVRNTRQASTRSLSGSTGANSTSCSQATSTITTEKTGDTNEATTAEVVMISTDTASDAQLSAQANPGQWSDAAADQTSNNSSPSSSSKRKNPRPLKNRGARWRAMLPNVPADDSDTQ